MKYLILLVALSGVTFTASASDVRGVVHYSDGDPIVGGTILVRRFTMNPLAPSDTRLIDALSSDASGRFAIKLPPGHYSFALIGDRCSWSFTKVPLKVVGKSSSRTDLDMDVARDTCTDCPH